MLYLERKRRETEVAQSCPTLCDPMDCSLPGFSVRGIFQATVLEWVAISFSRGSSRPRNRTQVSRIAGRRFTLWTTREAHLVYLNTMKWLFPKGRTFQLWVRISTYAYSVPNNVVLFIVELSECFMYSTYKFCYGLNVCVPPPTPQIKIHVSNPNNKCKGIWRRGIQRTIMS